MILLIDNYDSFSYNLYQYIGAINKDIKVIRNDELAIDEIDDLNPSHIVISPGPGKPCDAGICEEVIRSLQSRYPILGVCLGHQAICEVYGATIDHASRLMHGKMSIAHVDNESKLFKGLERDIEVARYHSLAAVKDTIPDCLKITAMTDDGEVMAVEHKDHKVFGVQFHPESILTPDGMTMIRNFLS